jgi:hypothetical protein
MNDMHSAPDPIAPEQIDELLSAELDGEFDAAARDLGLDPEATRAALDATPGIATRRRALAAARDALAKEPALDEVTATRLRSHALDRARQHPHERRWPRVVLVAASVAAALALVVGVVAARHRTETTANKASEPLRSQAGSASIRPNDRATPTSSRGINFGHVANAQQLVPPLKSLMADSVTSVWSSKQSSAADVAAGLPSSCLDDTRTDARVTGEPIVQGYATIGTSSVFVMAFGDGDERVLVVLSPDCHVVNRITFPPKG